MVRLVDRILVQALERSASDIHLEPQEDGLLIRLRQDGVLEQLDKLPKKLTPAVTSRLKIMADLDIANLIREGQTAQLYSQIQTGGQQGMQTLERALANLVQAGAVDRSEALAKASKPDELMRLLKG